MLNWECADISVVPVDSQNQFALDRLLQVSLPPIPLRLAGSYHWMDSGCEAVAQQAFVGRANPVYLL